MKKPLFASLTAMSLLLGGAGHAVAAEPITVTIDGVVQTYDQPPVVQDGRTLVPFRHLLDAFGATVSWDELTRTATATKGETTLVIPIGSRTATVNGQQVELDVPATILNDRTLVPLRFISESLQAEVQWDGAAQSVKICTLGCGKKQYEQPPAMVIDTKKDYTATIKTNKGEIQIHLFDDQAPLTVNNFVFLAREQFYKEVKFHRVIETFMIQTGDPTGTGSGGPGYMFEDELPPAKPYAPGIVAMANAGPNTNGSQFFIGSGDVVDGLNSYPNYTVFGEVVAGMDTVQKIAQVPVEEQYGGEPSKPTEPVYIISVEIEEK